MQRPAHEVEKETIHWIRLRCRADCCEDLLLAPAVDRRHADVPFHLRPALAVLQHWPKLRALFYKAEVRRMIREACDASVEAESTVVGRIDSGAIVVVGLRHDCGDAYIS